MSSGIDHSLKMWNINKDNVRTAIEQSDKFKQVNIKSFKTELINFPDFATRDVHYIDCVRWHNNLILSKS
jgi:polycomb protein EED